MAQGKRSSKGRGVKGQERSKASPNFESGTAGSSITLSDLSTKLKLCRERFLAASGKVNLLQLLGDQGIRSPLALVGEDQLRHRRFIEWFRENFIPASTSTLSSYFGTELSSNASMQSVTQSLAAPSLFSPLQLIVIYDFDKLKAPQAKLLLPHLQTRSDHVFVIVTAPSTASLRDRAQELSRSGTVTLVEEFSAAELRRWIVKEVARAGITGGISTDALEQLATVFGGKNLSLLAQEIAKAALLVDSNVPLTKGVLSQLLQHNPEHTSFELVNLIAARNTVAALTLTRRLLDQGLHPLQCCAFLSRAVRVMLALKSSARGVTGLHSDLSNSWFTRNLNRAATGYNLADLRYSLEQLKQLDLTLKSSGLQPELALSLAIQQLSQRTSPVL